MSTTLLEDNTSPTNEKFMKKRKTATPVPCSRGLPFKPRPVPIQYGRQPSRRAIKSPRISGCQFMQRYINKVEEEEMLNSSQELSELGSQMASQESESTLISASQQFTNDDDDLTSQYTVDTQEQFKTVSAYGRSSEYVTCSTMGDSIGSYESRPVHHPKCSSTGCHEEKEKKKDLPVKSPPAFQKELIKYESIERPRKQVEEESCLEISPVRAVFTDDMGQVNKRRRQRDVQITYAEMQSPSFDIVEASSGNLCENKCSTKVLEDQKNTLPYPDLSSVTDIGNVVVSERQKILETTPEVKTFEKCPRRGHRDAKKDRLGKVSTIISSTVVNTKSSSFPVQQMFPSDVSISSVLSDPFTRIEETFDFEDSSHSKKPIKMDRERRVTSTPLKSRVKDGLLALLSLDVSSVHKDESDVTWMQNMSRDVNSQEIVALSDDDDEDIKRYKVHPSLQSVSSEPCEGDSQSESSERLGVIRERLKWAKEVLNTQVSQVTNRRNREESGNSKKCKKQEHIPPHHYPPCFLMDEDIEYPSHIGAKVMVSVIPKKYCLYNDLIKNTPVDFLELMD